MVGTLRLSSAIRFKDSTRTTEPVLKHLFKKDL
jgi:hypothetical protein